MSCLRGPLPQKPRSYRQSLFLLVVSFDKPFGIVAGFGSFEFFHHDFALFNLDGEGKKIPFFGGGLKAIIFDGNNATKNSFVSARGIIGVQLHLVFTLGQGDVEFVAFEVQLNFELITFFDPRTLKVFGVGFRGNQEGDRQSR